MPTTNCPALPATTYCLASGLANHSRRCPSTPAQAYRLGHGEAAFFLARKCEVA